MRIRILKSIGCWFCSSQSTKFPLLHDYTINGYLGKGSTSNVFQGTKNSNNLQVVVKIFKDIIPQEKIKRQIRINQIISKSQHIVPLYDVIRVDDGSYALIFKNYKGVTLNHLIGKISEEDSIRYMWQIMKAIANLHSLNVVHCDIKPSNILIAKDGARLFDFGLSKQQGIDSFKMKRFGTKCYYTPEMLFRMPKYNRKVDVWVMGLIFAQMIARIKPIMPFKSDEETKRQLVKFCGYKQEIVDDKSLSKVPKVIWNQYIKSRNTSIIALVKSMMAIDPNERPQAIEVINNQLFQNMNNE